MTEDKWSKPLACSLCGERLLFTNQHGPTVESVGQVLEFRCPRGHGWSLEIIDDDSTKQFHLGAEIHTYVNAP